MELRPGYKHTEVGAIPEQWDVASLFDLADREKERFDDGDWIEAEFLTNNGVRLIQTGNIGEGYFIDKDTKKYISEASFEQLRCKALQVGDILICRLAEPAGRACILPEIEAGKLITAVDVTIFRPPDECVDRRYMVSVLSTERWLRLVSERCGGSTRSRIARSELGKLCVALPPYVEQRAIAEALGDVEALLVGLDRLIAKKRDLKQAAMQQLLTGQTRLPGFGGEWPIATVGREFEVKLGKMLDAEKNSGTPKLFIGNRAVQWGRIDASDLQTVPMSRLDLERFRLLKGDLLVCEGGEIGRAAIWNEPLEECYYQKALHRLRPVQSYNPEFMLALLHLWSERGTFANYVTQTSIAHLPRDKFIAMPLPVPSKAEQSAIAAVLSDIDAEIATLEQRRDKTRALKQAMMQELLTGRTRLV